MKRFASLLTILVALCLLASCAPAPTPQIIEKEVVVEKPVVETVVVEKEVVITPAPEAKPFEGVEVNILTFTGPQIAEPLQRRGPDFTELTGAKINVIVVPFSDLYTKILTDLATGTNAYDAWVFAPQWMVDYIVPGYMEDITDRVMADEALEWEDIAPFFRDFSATYQGRIYTIPLDGDFQMVYYRTDLLEEAGFDPPETWEDYL
ncbi:MAG TPA: extracellular solute-binding protein, partial [Anaerolineae bacterium]|nr:extracellular solute-binding protein [Anaerolineae bacterium]